MPDITVFEGASFYLDFTLIYSQNWSDSTKRGKAVAKSDTSKVFFYVKKKLSDTTFVLQLDDSDNTKIDWTDATNGKIRVKLNSNTSGKQGLNYYELRVKMADARYVTIDSGKLTINESVVDQAT